MQKNIYIAYALWFFSAPIGGGLHRIYCGKFLSGLLQLAMYWLGVITYATIIGIIIAIPIWIIWTIWWLSDVYFTGILIEKNTILDSVNKNLSQEETIKNIEALYELYQKGAISKEEYEARKEILMR